jgi:hypothetical protein
MKAPAVVSIAVAVAFASSEVAAAEACAPDRAAWLRITFAGEAFRPELQRLVTAQLDVDLREKHISLCEAADAPADAVPLADIALALSPGNVLSLEVRDSVTEKRLAREVPLSSVPGDALVLSIALATEELLRASWIEAAFPAAGARPPLEPPRPVPPVVAQLNAEQVARLPRTPVAQVAVLAVAERATGGLTGLGGDARFTWGRRLALGARFGVRASPDVGSANGLVRGREVGAGLAVEYALVSRDAPWGGALGVRGDVLDLQFSGTPAPGAQASSGSALTTTLSGVVAGWVRIGPPWRLAGEIAIGAPLHTVTATDSGTTAVSLSGLLVGVAVGIAAEL